MIIWATDYNCNPPKIYSIKIDGGQISENTIKIYDDLDQEITNIKFTSIEFQHVSESCVIKILYNDNRTQSLTVVGISQHQD